MLGEQEQVVVLGTHVAAWGMSWLSQKEKQKKKEKVAFLCLCVLNDLAGTRTHAGGALRYH